ncbi:unnamed protein product [Urochloa humidicola]
MAADCMTRLCALAIATAACVGLPCALVYETVRAAAARRSGTAAALSVFLVVWMAATAAYYPRVCADIVRQSPLLRRLRDQQAAARHRHYPSVGALFVARSRQQDHGGVVTAVPRELPDVRGGARVFGDGDDDILAAAASCGRHRDGALLVPPLFVARHHGGLHALRREPPTARGGGGGGGARVAAGNALLAPAERCVVCLCDVDKVETAAWLPACLHVFHRQCIDQWLHLHDQSTCPICRRDAFAAPPLPVVQAV